MFKILVVENYIILVLCVGILGSVIYIHCYLFLKLGEAGGEGPCICLAGIGLCVGVTGGGSGVVCS